LGENHETNQNKEVVLPQYLPVDSRPICAIAITTNFGRADGGVDDAVISSILRIQNSITVP